MKPLDALAAPLPSPVPSAADARQAIASRSLELSENKSFSPFDIFGIPGPYRSTDPRYMIHTNPDRSQYKVLIPQHQPAAALPPPSATSGDVGAQGASVEPAFAPTSHVTDAVASLPSPAVAEDVGIYDGSTESAIAPTEEDAAPAPTSLTAPEDIVMQDATVESAPAPASTADDASVLTHTEDVVPQHAVEAPRGT